MVFQDFLEGQTNSGLPQSVPLAMCPTTTYLLEWRYRELPQLPKNKFNQIINISHAHKNTAELCENIQWTILWTN